jgi:hypothetical protein
MASSWSGYIQFPAGLGGENEYVVLGPDEVFRASGIALTGKRADYVYGIYRKTLPERLGSL